VNMAEYLDLPGISATAIKAGATSMRHMRLAVLSRQEPTQAMQWGSLVHLAVLEPARLATDVAVWTGGRKFGGQWMEFLELAGERLIVTEAELDKLTEISGAVRRHSEAAKLLSGCEYERTVQWTGEGYGPAKARLDALGTDRVVDVKTTARIASAERTAWNLGYHLQLGWYLEGAATVHPGCKDGYLIFVEAGQPFDVLCLKAGYDVLEKGQVEARRIATEYRRCEEANDWPGIEAGVRTWSLPAWEQLDISDDSNGGDQL
jgi:hypothetical protein